MFLNFFGRFDAFLDAFGRFWNISDLGFDLGNDTKVQVLWITGTKLQPYLVLRK